jgi:transcriptional regulator with XRE-family HTH domain
VFLAVHTYAQLARGARIVAKPQSPRTPARDLIRKRREEHVPKLSMREAARRAGRSPSWWRMYETGERGITRDAVAEMAIIVGVTPTELEEFGDTDAAEALRTLMHAKIADEPGLADVGEVALTQSRKGSDALLIDIVSGLTEIRNESRLTPVQRVELETAYVQGLQREVAAQIENLRLMIRLTRGGGD